MQFPYRKGLRMSTKQLKKLAILNLLRARAAMTKPELAMATDLTFATISNLMSELEAQGLVRETGTTRSSGGRKAVQYQINPTTGYFLGIDVQAKEVLISVVNLAGSVVHTHRVSVEMDANPVMALPMLRQVIEAEVIANELPRDRIWAIGVSAPGPVDVEKGIVTHPPDLPEWRNVPIRELFEREFGVPVYVEKDTNAAAFGESRFGAGTSAENLIYVIVDADIGGGVILNRQLYRGFLYGAGGIGHMPVTPDGPRCNCGNFGCLDTVASGSALQRQIADTYGENLTLDELTEKSQTHFAEEFSNAGKWLGTVVGGLCNVLNPEMIVLGGPVVEESTVYYDAASTAIRRHMHPEFANRTQIRIAKLGKYSAAIGAAHIALQDFVYGEGTLFMDT
jgi:predicted NBD/HSP70 family sugar kinase